MAEQYRKTALLGALGVEEDDPIHQPGPIGGGMELPSSGGGNYRPAPYVPVGPFSDGASYVSALEERAKDPALQQWGRDIEDQSRRAFEAHGFGDKIPGTFGGAPSTSFAPSPEASVPASSIQTTPDYRKPGKYTSTAYDATKMQRPWEEMSEKYRIGTVLSNFDPSQGLTPEVIDALNKADIFGAKFSGSGDKLTVDNAGGYERFGKGGTSDVNIGFKTGKGTWGAWTDPALEAASAPQGGMAGSQADPLLQGNAMSSIQQAIEALMQGGNKPNLQALIEQLGVR